MLNLEPNGTNVKFNGCCKRKIVNTIILADSEEFRQTWLWDSAFARIEDNFREFRGNGPKTAFLILKPMGSMLSLLGLRAIVNESLEVFVAILPGCMERRIEGCWGRGGGVLETFFEPLGSSHTQNSYTSRACR